MSIDDPILGDYEAGLIRVDPDSAARIGRDNPQRPVERAYQGIRHAIVTGMLRPGDHLREEPLAAMTGTSRTPVREALRRLVAEGLATAENRHRFVTDFSYEEVVIVFELRAKVESYAASVAAQKITDDEIRKLERIVAAIDGIDPTEGTRAANQFIELNSQFHGTVVDATRSRQLKHLTAQAVSLPLVLIKQFVWDQRINIVRSNAQHRDIVAALAQHDREWAASAMNAHILSTKPRPRDSAQRGQS